MYFLVELGVATVHACVRVCCSDGLVSAYDRVVAFGIFGTAVRTLLLA